MMQEQIHDALNYIDDDMIEAVEALRAANAERKKLLNIYRLKPSMYVAAAAACLMIIATTTLVISPFLRSARTSDMAAPEGGAVYDGGMTTCGSAVTGNGAIGATTTGIKSSTVLVKITSVTENGFTAMVLEGYAPEIDSDSKDIRGDSASGTGAEYVYVAYSEDTELVENPELSVGSIVRVEYSEVKADKVTADKIMPEDYKED